MIRLFTDGIQWYADFKHAQDADKVFKLFGTCVLPLPVSTGDATAGEMSESVQRGYPEEDVYVDQQS